MELGSATMYRIGTLTRIISYLDQYRLDITAVQEVRWDESSSIKSQENTILVSGGEKYERVVGFVIKDNSYQMLKSLNQ